MKRDLFTYYQPGLIKYFQQYIDKVRHGDSALFNLNQEIIHRCNWIDDRGEIAETKNGINLSSVSQCIGNIKHGVETRYYNSGDIKSKYMYSNGIKQGCFVKYYQNYQQKIIGSYQDGLKHGIQVEYFHNCKHDEWTIKKRIEYIKGFIEGDYIEYDRSGNAIIYQIYQRGKLIQTKFNRSTYPLGLFSMTLPGQQCDCPICFQYKDLLVTPCNHSICQDCIQSWDQACSILQCPLCRYELE